MQMRDIITTIIFAIGILVLFHGNPLAPVLMVVGAVGFYNGLKKNRQKKADKEYMNTQQQNAQIEEQAVQDKEIKDTHTQAKYITFLKEMTNNEHV